MSGSLSGRPQPREILAQDGVHLGAAPSGDAALAPHADGSDTDPERPRHCRHCAARAVEKFRGVHAETLGGLTCHGKCKLTQTPNTDRTTQGHRSGTTSMPKQRPLTAREIVIMDRIGDMLRNRGATWADLARAVGKSPSSASQWSGRRSFPREAVLHSIAQWLGVAMGWLLTGEEPQEKRQAQTVNELAALELLREMSPPEQAAAVAALRGIKGSLTKK